MTSQNADSGALFGPPEQAIATLEQLRRELCAYDHLALEKPPPTCDCKYANVGSAGRPLHSGEATGCPELRLAIVALAAPTAEYVEWLIDLVREARQYVPEATGIAEDMDDLFATLSHNGQVGDAKNPRP